jgi:hypothetical protein
MKLIQTILVVLQVMIIAAMIMGSNSQDYGRTYENVNTSCVNLAGSGYGITGTGTPFNVKATGDMYYEFPAFCSLNSAENDDFCFFGVSWVQGQASVVTGDPVTTTTVVPDIGGLVSIAPATAAGARVELPSAVSNPGNVVIVKLTGASSYPVTLSCVTGETVDGSTTYALTDQYDTMTIISDGVEWLITSEIITTH